jgi:Amt family ammonium transporter
MFHNVGAIPLVFCDDDANCQTRVSGTILAIFELGFAIVTPIVIAASVNGIIFSFDSTMLYIFLLSNDFSCCIYVIMLLIDRVKPNSLLFFVFMWHLVVYCPVAHVVWFPAGWFRSNIIEDFAGGIVVNMCAAATILALHVRLGWSNRPKNVVASRPDKSLLYSLVVFFLWFGWIAGKQWNAGPVAGQVIVNCVAVAMTGVLCFYFTTQYFDMDFSAVSAANAIMLSLVAIQPAAGFVTVGGAMCISIFAVLITLSLCKFCLGELRSSNESMSVLAIHGVGGTIGFLCTAIFSYEYINPEWPAKKGLTAGRGMTLAHHISAMLAIWSCVFVASYICAVISDIIAPMMSDEEYLRITQCDSDLSPEDTQNSLEMTKQQA